MKHVNVYGPPASGKTRNAEMLRKKYGCVVVVDEGKSSPGAWLSLKANKRALVLSIEPIVNEHFANIPIKEALR